MNEGEDDSEDEETNVDIVGGGQSSSNAINKNSPGNSQSSSGANANINILSTTPLTFSNQKRDGKQDSESFSRGQVIEDSGDFNLFQIDLFDMTKTPDQEYSWFLRYTDCSTRRICLRPITTGTGNFSL
jgi:hypothetical protein